MCANTLSYILISNCHFKLFVVADLLVTDIYCLLIYCHSPLMKFMVIPDS